MIIETTFKYYEDCLIPVEECKVNISDYFTIWFIPKYLKQVTGIKRIQTKKGYIKADLPSPENWRVKLPDKIFE